MYWKIREIFSKQIKNENIFNSSIHKISINESKSGSKIINKHLTVGKKNQKNSYEKFKDKYSKSKNQIKIL